MTKQEHLDAHLRLCEDIFERMQDDGTWPWPDSPKSKDLVESVDNTENV